MLFLAQGGSMLTIILSLIAANSFAEVGFKRGNELQVQPVYGTAYIVCTDFNNLRRQKTVSCSADIVSPTLRDKFVTAGPVDADKVELKSTFENGRSITRTSSFDGPKGESKSAFNLWINTVTQNPMLRPGKNVVDYKLTKKKDVVETGTFIAFADVKDVKRCEPRSLPFTYECDNDFEVCDDYFWANNNCEND